MAPNDSFSSIRETLVLILLFALALLQTAAPKPGRRPLPLDPAVVTGKLPNGLTYYIRPNARPARRAELRLVVNAGSILEDEDQRGLAHFVEHMAFNGTVHFKKQALVDYIEAIGMRFGADLNASTSFDETIYQLQVPTDTLRLLDTGLQILEDWARGVSFDTTEIRKERGVVIEEWRLGQGAGNRMFKTQLPVLFRGSRYSERLPIGTKEGLETFSPKALTRFYRDWYRPDLMAVVAVGDFDVAMMTRMIRTRFGRIPALPARRPRPAYAVPVRDSTAVAIATDPEATSTSFSVYYIKPGRVDPSAAAYRRSLIGELYAQMLNQRLSELTQKPNPPFVGAGGGEGRLVRGNRSFSLGAGVADTGLERGISAVMTEVQRIERHGFTTTELARTRKELLRNYEQAFAERDKTESGSLVEEYVQHFLTGEPAPGIAAEFDRVKTVLPDIRLEDVNAAAQSWLGLRDRVLLVNAPRKPTVTVPESARLLAIFDQVKHADVAAYHDEVSDAPLIPASLTRSPVVSETRDSVLGVTRWTLANGIRVVVRPTDFKADEVLLSAFSPGGTSVEPDSLYLAAAFATQLTGLGGIGAFNAVELQKKLAGKAVFISPFIGTYQEGFRGQASPKDLETLFQLLYLQFTSPRADPEAFQAFKSNARAALANRSANPATAFRDTLAVTLSQHHPRTRPISAAIVDSFDLDRSLGIYRERFADAGDFTFIIVGTVSLDSVKPLVERYLGNLPRTGRTETWRDVKIETPAGVVERDVRKGLEPKSQTELVFSGSIADERTERFVLRSLADVLEIKLREQLREELGGTYGVSVSGSASRVPRNEYSVTIDFGSAPDRAAELARMVFIEIDSLQRFGPAEKELAKIRESTIRSHETDLRENGYWLGQLSAFEQFGGEAKAFLRIDDLLSALTVDRIKTAAVRYLDSRRFVRVTLFPEARQ